MRALAIASALVVVTFLGLNVFAHLDLRRIWVDVTERQFHTIQPSTRNLLLQVDEPIEATLFRSSSLFALDPKLATFAERVQATLASFEEASNGLFRVRTVDPSPVSFEEDRAIAMGIEPISLDITGDVAYFGLGMTNTVDDLALIERLEPDRETFLESDLRALIRDLIVIDKPSVRLVSGIPLENQNGRLWSVVDDARALYEVDMTPGSLQPLNHDVLWLIDPIGLRSEDIDEIEQFTMRGGSVLVFTAQENLEEPRLQDWLDKQGVKISPNALGSSAERLEINNAATDVFVVRADERLQFDPRIFKPANREADGQFANADINRFIISVIDKLAGLPDITSESLEDGRSRPFTRLDAVRAKAESNFLLREIALRQRISNLQQMISDRETEVGSLSVLSTDEGQKSLAGLRDELLAARLELRDLRRSLIKRVNEEKQKVIVFNVIIPPLIIVVIGLCVAIYRSLRFRGRHRNNYEQFL